MTQHTVVAEREHRLRVVRRARGISVNEVAKELLVSKATISRIERFKQDPSLALVRKLCVMFQKEGLAAHDFVNIEQAA